MAEAYAKEYQAAMRKPGYIKGFDEESADKFKKENKNKKNEKMKATTVAEKCDTGS